MESAPDDALEERAQPDASANVRAAPCHGTSLSFGRRIMTFPTYWQSFIESAGLVGGRTTIPEEKDASGVGADIYWFTDEQAREEKDEFYPGIAVAKDGFVPVGGCDTGSGDPYFICVTDGADGPLYRVYHDSVREDGYDRDEAVAVVLQDYRQILSFK
jgi:hypothetical protein